MEATTNFSIFDMVFSAKGFMVVTVFAVVLVMYFKIISNKRNHITTVKITKGLNLKQNIEIKVHQAVDHMQTDIKSFKGLKHNEIDAITLKNTRLNSGSRNSSSKSISEISFEKLDWTTKHTLLIPNSTKNCDLYHSYDDLRSVSTFSSINSEELLFDYKLDSPLDSESKHSDKWKVKRVSFNW